LYSYFMTLSHFKAYFNFFSVLFVCTFGFWLILDVYAVSLNAAFFTDKSNCFPAQSHHARDEMFFFLQK